MSSWRMKVCKNCTIAEAMALGGSQGHPSHIYYQLFITANHSVFRKLKSHLKILIYGIFFFKMAFSFKQTRTTVGHP